MSPCRNVGMWDGNSNSHYSAFSAKITITCIKSSTILFVVPFVATWIDLLKSFQLILVLCLQLDWVQLYEGICDEPGLKLIPIIFPWSIFSVAGNRPISAGRHWADNGNPVHPISVRYWRFGPNFCNSTELFRILWIPHSLNTGNPKFRLCLNDVRPSPDSVLFFFSSTSVRSIQSYPNERYAPAQIMLSVQYSPVEVYYAPPIKVSVRW